VLDTRSNENYFKRIATKIFSEEANVQSEAMLYVYLPADGILDSKLKINLSEMVPLDCRRL